MQCKSDGNMEDVVTENVCSPPPDLSETQESHDVQPTESAENFQKFMYELFEKNGVINDLRAYLRGHIVGILRSARTGDPPPCQKHFTQRLELPYQALNILLAEYLLRLEFNYTLSVFISEIPLANMVLDFAKSLMEGNNFNSALRFKDEDVWSILNYLGVRCDSDHASNIVEMYGEETQPPLLLCMLKCMPMYTPIGKDSSQGSLSSSCKSSDTIEACSRSHRAPSRCKHLVFCKTCHGKLLRIKDKYKKKKETLAKNKKESSAKPQHVDSLMKNIDVIERSLIDEMFQQLKSVYEAEMQLVKTEEEDRVKRSLAAHAVQLQRKQIEMEESFKAREMELTRNVQAKKRFLWGLARLLREQHQQMSRAMLDVQAETSRLSAKENSLKSQLAEAEAILRARGVDMRRQISSELAILEGHLDSMKKERESINKERSELEHIKHLCENNSKATNIETTKEDLRSHYDLLQNEFSILKKYIEGKQAKCVIERSTTTDDSVRADGALNNGQGLDRSRSEDRLKTGQVVNDLKKMKNVNFSQANLAEMYRERSRSSASHSTVSSEGGDTTRDVARRDVVRRDTRDVTRDATTRYAARRLMEENERLRNFARQQREHIDELSSHQARLQAELTAARLPPPPVLRPRTAPPSLPNNGTLVQRMSAGGGVGGAAGLGWRAGAGEQLALWAGAPPRVLVPGDTLPFIGLLRDRHNDSRRYLINQWRSLRRRMSPVGGVAKSRAGAARDFDRERPNSAGPSVRLPPEEDLNNNERQEVTLEIDHSYKPPCDKCEQRAKTTEVSAKKRENNPKLALREAKETIKSREYVGRRAERDPSPGAVVRDAKLRLRKLEIEAEAVEQSYLDFRRKQDAMRGDRRAANTHYTGKETDLKQDRASFKAYQSRVESTSRHIPPQQTAYEQIIEDIDEYRAKYDIGLTHFKNKNATPMKVRPIPNTSPYATPLKPNLNRNYLDTSMAEFRKYYHSGKRAVSEGYCDQPRTLPSRNRSSESPAVSSLTPRLAEVGPTSQITRHSETLPRTSNAATERNEPNLPKNRDPSSPSSEVSTRSPKIKKGQVLCTEVHRQTKHDKAKELEILKQNINKMYNVSEKSIAENCDYKAVDAEWKKNERKGISQEPLTEASRDGTRSDPVDDKNLLRIEIQSVSQVNDVQIESQRQDLLLVVERTNVDRSGVDFPEDIISTQMTVLVSPKRSSGRSDEVGMQSLDNPGEKSAKCEEDILNSLYQAARNENISSVQMQLENSNDVLVPFLSDIENEDYPDDFSAEVDNCVQSNSLKHDTDRDRSPISMAKTSEDENFWDS